MEAARTGHFLLREFTVFTGLIEEVGRVERTSTGRESRRLSVSARQVLEGLAIDDSVSVDGVCLTVTDVSSGRFEATAVAATLERTAIGDLKTGDPVNLERALRVGDRLGGHFVQGHADGVGRLLRIRPRGDSLIVEVELPPELQHYIVPQGSIALNGVSLTVLEKGTGRLSVSLIPHTLANTAFRSYKPGRRLNIEVDLLAKYIETFVQRRFCGSVPTNDRNWESFLE
jgi:riboflavin synthase